MWQIVLVHQPGMVVVCSATGLCPLHQLGMRISIQRRPCLANINSDVCCSSIAVMAMCNAFVVAAKSVTTTAPWPLSRVLCTGLGTLLKPWSVTRCALPWTPPSWQHTPTGHRPTCACSSGMMQSQTATAHSPSCSSKRQQVGRWCTYVCFPPPPLVHTRSTIMMCLATKWHSRASSAWQSYNG
jgi:hypothetical protein